MLFVGGEIFTPGSRIKGTLGIENGKVAFISSSDWTPPATQTIDVTGKLLVPGFIDSHVHFRDPGLTYKEDFLTGTRAAAAGGVTCVADMPNNKPALTTEARFHAKLAEIKDKAVVERAIAKPAPAVAKPAVTTPAVPTPAVTKPLAAKPAGALRAHKRLLKRAFIGEVKAAIAAENKEFAERLGSAESKEAFAAFLEKRPPNFTHMETRVAAESKSSRVSRTIISASFRRSEPSRSPQMRIDRAVTAWRSQATVFRQAKKKKNS